LSKRERKRRVGVTTRPLHGRDSRRHNSVIRPVGEEKVAFCRVAAKIVGNVRVPASWYRVAIIGNKTRGQRQNGQSRKDPPGPITEQLT
jgi:hypothetical protein